MTLHERVAEAIHMHTRLSKLPMAVVEDVIRAYMWTCDDPVCDCSQPVVDRVSDGPPYLTERLWAGTFTSRDLGYVGKELQGAELTEAAARFGVVAPEEDTKP